MSETYFGDLDAFLASSARPEGTLSYRALQGFLFALACAPETVVPGEWLPKVFSRKEAGFADQDEAQRVLGLLVEMYNETTDAVLEESYVLPDECALLDDVLGNFGPDGPVGQWSLGFLLGHQRLEESWDAHVPKELTGEFGAIMLSLSYFSSARLARAFIDEMKSRPTLQAFSETMRETLPAAIQGYVGLARAIQMAKQEVQPGGPPPGQPDKVGRNEPCPCGSGKKFKRCCGVVH